MDTSEAYIKMCQRCQELQVEKWRKGFAEGDYVYDGRIVETIGNDFLSIGRAFSQHEHFSDSPREYRFALIEPFKATMVNNDLLPSSVSFRFGTYAIHTIYNPVWLPRQDQLQEMMAWNITGRFGVMMIDALYLFSKEFYKSIPFGDDFTTWERLWLSFTMHKKYRKYWDGKSWTND